MWYARVECPVIDAHERQIECGARLGIVRDTGPRVHRTVAGVATVHDGFE